MNTKIFITYHDEHQLIKSDIFTPIQTGRSLAIKKFDNMLGDDTGDNISFLNDCFCEMSAIYWVWKNQNKINNPHNIGFMHYRRHFLFGEKDYKQNFYGLVKLGKINAEYMNTDLTNDENISKICENYDAIIPQKIDITTLGKEKTNYEHYKKHHDISDYNKAIKIISNKYPEYLSAVEKYNSSKYAYFLNMFIFRKEIFNEYCEWLFDILFDLYDMIDRNKKDTYQQRTIGFIAERLTAIFIYRLLDKNISIKELPVSFVDTVLPNITENNNTIPIAVASSNEYVPILSTCLESIKINSNPNFIYEVNILERNISLKNKRKLEEQFANSQIKIKYINIKDKINKLENYINPQKHYSVDTLSRFFISNVLNYDKCIYLDIDTIVLSDLKNLYDIDLGENYLAATKDVIFLALCNCNKKMFEYATNILKLDYVENYFQAGVLLLNLKKMRNEKIEELSLKTLENVPVKFSDQCIFNYLLKNKINYIDMTWNYQIYDEIRQKEHLKDFLPVRILKDYNYAFKYPKIIHFSGPLKPWLEPSEEYADIWWNYARKTPFYDQIIANITTIQMTQYITNSRNYDASTLLLSMNQYNIKLLYVINHFLYFQIKKNLYKIKKNITFGKRHEKYQAKYNNIKQLLKDARKFKKQIIKG